MPFHLRHRSMRVAAPQLFFFITSTLATPHSSFSYLVSTGLKNLGNTCYLNAQLQSAFHIPLVRNLIIHGGSNFHQKDDNTESSSPGLQALQQVFRDMETASATGSGPVAPWILCRTLGIPVMEQQDSQEFWKLLLPVLNVPELTDLYQGAFEDYIAAVDGSHRERRREEPFLDLSLDVASGSVEGSLHNLFGKPELLSEAEGNGWRPEKGADKVDALKGNLLRVEGLPSILQLHLKRFHYDWQTDTMTKLNDSVTFPKELDLSTVCTAVSKNEAPRALYYLQSVVIHVGNFGTGHYYTYVRPDIHSDVWYRCDDHIMTEVTYNSVQQDAFGGRTSEPSKTTGRHRGILKRVRNAFQGQGYGWGGRTASAYVLQYVRHCDIPELYDEKFYDEEL